MKWNSHLIHLIPAHNLLGSFFPSLSSFMARWPWHLTVPPSDMPRCQEFSSSELCPTTNRILYHRGDSRSGGREKREKEVDGTCQSWTRLLSELALVEALKCEGQWCIFTNSSLACRVLEFWLLLSKESWEEIPRSWWSNLAFKWSGNTLRLSSPWRLILLNKGQVAIGKCASSSPQVSGIQISFSFFLFFPSQILNVILFFYSPADDKIWAILNNWRLIYCHWTATIT